MDEFDVLCLGAGVCGEAIGGELKGSGLTVAIVESGLVGGECPYWGCVPSKTLLRSGETLAESGRARQLAASQVEWTVDMPKISKRVLWMARDLDDTNPAKALEAAGAVLVRGEGQLTGPRTIDVGGRRLTARKALIVATGSEPVVPPIPGLQGTPFWTNRDAVLPKALPESLAILGGGAIGAEVAQAYGRIGCRVELIEAGPRLVAAEEPEASDVLRPHLEADGVKVHLGMRCTGVEHSEAGFKLQLEGAQPVTAEKLLVATGRKARLGSVDLAAAGLATTERGWLKVNPSTLEAAGGIFGGGDVTGIGGFTHLAFYHGQVITMRLLGGDNRADHTAVPRVTFTDPEVASVGLSERGAFERNIDAVTVVTDPGETARGYIHDFKGGVVKLVADRQARVLVGATIVQPRAGEMLGELSLAVKQRIPLRELSDLIHPFPAFSRVLGAALRELHVKAR